MVKKRFRLRARVSTANPQAIGPVLKKVITKGAVKKAGDEFMVQAEMQGPDAKEEDEATCRVDF